jgi:chorismate synthase
MEKQHMTTVAATQNTVTNSRSAASTVSLAAKGRKDKTIYWVSTVIVCAVMVFSAVNFNLSNPLGPMKGAFAH